jgi:uncharacterized membrane protein YbhN (UPF0104 family)
MMNSHRRKILLALKLTVTTACIVYLYRTIDLRTIATTFSSCRADVLLISLLVYWGAQICVCLRCQLILQNVGAALPLTKILSAHFIGLWFSQILPGTVGGDVTKALILGRDTGLSRATRAILLDRIAGLLILLETVLLMAPLYDARFHIGPWPTLAGLFGGILLLTLCVLLGKYHDHFAARAGLLFRLAEDASQLFRRAVWRTQLWTSITGHFLVIAVYGLIGYSLDIRIESMAILLITPLLFLVTMLPVSLAGWGIRELSAVWLFGLAGVNADDSIAVSLAFGFFMLLASLPGLVLFLARQQRTPV